MVRTDIGHVEVRVRDEVFKIVPSFLNISLIGTPKEIIDCFPLIENPATFRFELTEGNLIPVSFSVSNGFAWACRILNCCGLPERITGSTVWRDDENGIPRMFCMVGKIPVHDVFVLAAHCLKHGVVGELPSEGQGEAITEFDAKYFIVLSQKILDISLGRAEQMTMTELSRYVNARKDFDSGRYVKRAELNAQKKQFSWYERMEQKRKAARANKNV